MKKKRRKFKPMSQADKALALVRAQGHPDRVAVKVLAAWRQRPYEVPTDAEVRRLTRKNPRMQNLFVLLATKGKGKRAQVLKYIGGVRFSTKGRAVKFDSRRDAETVARDLRSRFPILKGYTLRVQS
jgi:hypothetical protein